MAGLLEGLLPEHVSTALYRAYFNRAPDSSGFNFWLNEYAMALSKGQAPAEALTNVANAFAPQPETAVLYPFLVGDFDSDGDLDVRNAENTPAFKQELVGLIQGIYDNMFGRVPAADDAGVQYWVDEIFIRGTPLGKIILSIANGAIGADADALIAKITADGPPMGETEQGSEGTLALQGNAESVFVAPNVTLDYQLSGALFSTDLDAVSVTINGVAVPASQYTISGDQQRLTMVAALEPGRNLIEIGASDDKGALLYSESVIWSGSQNLTVQVLDAAGNPVAGADIAAKLTEDQDVLVSAVTAADGTVTFVNVPNRNILIESSSGGQYGFVSVIGGVGATTVKLTALQEPSPVDNNDFSQGVEGWSVGSAPVSLVSHQALAAADMSVAADAAAPDVDLVLSTSGQGTQTIARTFQVSEDTASVTVRYKFITSEVPGGYFGSPYNDDYRVSIRSADGQIISDANSMNGLGLTAFDAGGATAFRELTLVLDGKATTVQVEGAVSNVADNLFDSQLRIDFVKQGKLAIPALDLNDIDNSNLRFLSASDQNIYFGGNTLINGTLDFKGNAEDSLSSVKLEILAGGAVVATANLTKSAESKLLGVEFGDDETLSFGSSGRLFELSAAQAGNIPRQTDTTVTLRVAATSAGGETATKDFGAVQVLDRYLGQNRYGQRDGEQGGDDWALPSTIDIVEHFANQITVNDFSNMNGGTFSPHKSHQDGRHVDGWYSGYNSRDAAAAQTMIGLLNDDTYGDRIQTAYVTYDRGNVNDPFWTTIQNVALDDGRSAADVIRPLAGHDTHFHWVFGA